MGILEALVLGIIQGLSEFIPISSSGHLVIAPWLLGWPEPSVTFDTMLHLGTIVAVLVYFREDIVTLLAAWLSSLVSRSLADPKARLAWLIVLATVPAAVLGAVFSDFFESAFSSPRLVGFLLMGTAAILVLAEQVAKNREQLSQLGWPGALAVGFAQALAILPGISRSGATIAAGLTVGMRRAEAARFSFLLSIPIILGTGGSQLLKLVRHPAAQADTQLSLVLVGFLAAAISGYLAIGFLLRYLRSRSLYLFAGYAALAGLLAVTVSFVR